ncbi:uncharacterized protein [Ptychodera flava]|uniref:uncharacterized protein isoform X2 n=1 Tax=Ptychodera flava TaxID=63121 RepID=UPI003969D6A5
MPRSSGIPCYIDGQQQKLPMDLAEHIPLTTPVESSEKNTTNGKDDKDYPRENPHIVADVPGVSVQLKKPIIATYQY